MLSAMERHKPYGIYERFFKRPLDAVCALLALILFCWLFALIALLVRTKLGSPVLFKQERPGKDEKIFTMYKFRTMTDEKDENGKLLPDGIRLTKFGRFLRHSSLDELPEMINILRGDMSIVGPRPLLIKYLPLYSERQRHRHDVRPGLSGYAQVNGRNLVTWTEKFEMDIEYVNHITFSGDVKIFFQTIFSVLTQDGIDSGQTQSPITKEEFNGVN